MRLRLELIGMLFWCCSLAVGAEVTHPIAPLPPPRTASSAITSPVPSLQEPLSATSPSEEMAKLNEIKPSLYYLPDQQGQLVPMFGFAYEEFMSFFEQIEQGQAQLIPPGYVIDRLSANGRAREDRAEIDLNLEMTTLQEGPLCVPLGLSRSAMQGVLQYEGEGNAFLEFDSRHNEYVCWIYSKVGKKHRLSLPLVIPLLSVGEETRLNFRLPRATHSEWIMEVPIAEALTKASDGVLLKKMDSSKKGTSRFRAVGLRGNGWISWQKPSRTGDARANLIEATGEILVRINGYSVNSEAALQIRGHGRPFDRFQIRLPAGSELVSGGTAEYQVVPLEKNQKEKNDEPMVEVRLHEKTLGPVTIHLTTRQPLEAVRTAQWVQLGNFTILNAVRQSGYLGIQVATDLFVSWFPERGIHQVEAIPETLKMTDSTVGFSYFAQPCLLRARVMPRKSRISVEPEYLVHVGAKRIDLEGTLKYSIGGKKALVLNIDLGRWVFDSVGPERLVAIDGVEVNEQGVLSIPLLQPSTGPIELKLKAHRPVPEESPSLHLRFPEPQIASPDPAALAILPAAIVILPADNVQLKPNLLAIQGLNRQQVAPPMPIPVRRQQAPFFYRGELGNAIFAADFAVRQREMAVAIDSRVTFEGNTGRVEEKLTYQIDYEPCDRLTFDVPAAIAQRKDLTVLLDAQPVILLEAADSLATPNASRSAQTPENDGPDSTTESTPEEPTTILDQLPIPGPQKASKPVPTNQDTQAPSTVSMFLPLKSPRIGSCEISFHYWLPEKELLPDSSLIREIPLVLPHEGELSGHRLSVVAPPGVQVSSQSTAWTVGGDENRRITAAGLHQAVPKSGPNGQAEHTWAASQRVGLATLGLFMESRNEPEAIVVRRVLIQTWLNESSRQDRAMFRFVTARPRIKLLLPKIATSSTTECLLDGRPQEITFQADGTVELALPHELVGQERLLEIRYHGPFTHPGHGHFRMTLPRLDDGTWTHRVYWQLNLPSNEHLLATPDKMVGEFTWRFSGLFCKREPLLEPPSLELWIGSDSSNLFAADDYYLLGSFGEVSEVDLVTAGRAWIVLIGSGIALVFGLLLIYVPVCRHPITLLLGTVGLIGVSLLWPEPTLLLLQASALGLLLTLVAGLLERTMARRRRNISILDAGSSILDHDSTQTQPLPNLAQAMAESTKTSPRPSDSNLTKKEPNSSDSHKTDLSQ